MIYFLLGQLKNNLKHSLNDAHSRQSEDFNVGMLRIKYNWKRTWVIASKLI